MQNNISTNVVKLDLQTILANYKNPEFWNKHWNIISTKEIDIEWHMESIDCTGSKIRSCVQVTKRNVKRGKKDLSRYWWEKESVQLSAIPINNNSEYTETHFKNALLGSIISLLQDVERHFIYQYAEYKEAEKLYQQTRKALEEIAEKFLDENGVTNEDIREAYTEKYVNDHAKDTYTAKVVSNYQFKIIPNMYLFTYAWFNEEKLFDKFEKDMGAKKSLRIEMWNKVKELQTDKWKNGMKTQLKNIFDKEER